MDPESQARAVHGQVGMAITPPPAPRVVQPQPTPQQMIEEINRLAAMSRDQEQLIQRLQEQLTSSTGVRRPRVDPPAAYDGRERNTPIRNWFPAMEQYFDMINIVADRQRILQATSRLEGAAQTWWFASRDRLLGGTWEEFKNEMAKEFQPILPEWDARRRLKKLKQQRSVQEYTRLFREIILYIPDMSDGEKIDRFVDGLKDNIKRAIYMGERPTNFRDAVVQAEQADHAEQDLRYRIGSSSAPPRRTGGGPTPMELGERQQTGNNWRGPSQAECYWCGKIGHFKRDCNRRKQGLPRVVKTGARSNTMECEEQENE